jgi:hypothetical protein
MAEENGKAKESEKEGVVEVDVKDYSMLLDRLEELEDLVGQQKEGKEGKEDEREEGEPNPKDVISQILKDASKDKQKDYDKMTPTQLMGEMQNMVQENLQKVMTSVHALSLQREIDNLLGQDQYSDLMDYEEEIYDIMSENPKMNIKRAYLLAKQENPKKSEKENEGGKRQKSYRERLPDPRRRDFGEKPGVSRSSTGEGDSKTMDDAASRAFDQIFEGKKNN